MNYSDILLARRSVRKFTGDPIPEDKLKAVLSAGLLAPTSMNKKPCQFYVVRNKDILKQLSKAKKAGAGFLADAVAAIVVTADANKSDVWVEDCSVAMSFMNLAAVDQGLGSCWVQMRNRTSLLGKDAEQNVKTVLNIPEKYRLVGVLGLGTPDKAPKPHTLDDIDETKLHFVD